MSEETRVTPSSGNVFADLGLSDADQLLAKADLAIEITRIIEERGLTQVEAAELMGVDQPKVSALVRGRLDGFSMERLYRFLNALGPRRRDHREAEEPDGGDAPGHAQGVPLACATDREGVR